MKNTLILFIALMPIAAVAQITLEQSCPLMIVTQNGEPVEGVTGSDAERYAFAKIVNQLPAGEYELVRPNCRIVIEYRGSDGGEVVPVPVPVPDPDPEPAPDMEFAFCANEGETCELEEPTLIRYGADGVFFEQTFLAGAVQCNNATFGDPVRGVAKMCERLVNPDQSPIPLPAPMPMTMPDDEPEGDSVEVTWDSTTILNANVNVIRYIVEDGDEEIMLPHTGAMRVSTDRLAEGLTVYGVLGDGTRSAPAICTANGCETTDRDARSPCRPQDCEDNPDGIPHVVTRTPIITIDGEEASRDIINWGLPRMTFLAANTTVNVHIDTPVTIRATCGSGVSGSFSLQYDAGGDAELEIIEFPRQAGDVLTWDYEFERVGTYTARDEVCSRGDSIGTGSNNRLVYVVHERAP